MINASEMYERGRSQNFLRDEHVNEIFQIYSNRTEKQHVSKIIRTSEIVDEDWNLSILRYMEPRPTEDLPPLQKAAKDLENAIFSFQNSEKDLIKIFQKETHINA